MRTVEMFCLSCAGGNASAGFSHWKQQVPPWLKILPVDLPGRGRKFKEAPLTSLPELVHACSSHIERAATGPYLLFGHSFGALLAYSCALYLRGTLRSSPLALIAACCSSPSEIDCLKYKRTWTDDDVEKELMEIGGVSEELMSHQEIKQMAIRQFRDDVIAMSEFIYDEDTEKLHFPIISVGGVDDDIPKSEIHSWRKETLSRHDMRMFNGSHFFFDKNPGELIKYLIEQAHVLVQETVNYRA